MLRMLIMTQLEVIIFQFSIEGFFFRKSIYLYKLKINKKDLLFLSHILCDSLANLKVSLVNLLLKRIISLNNILNFNYICSFPQVLAFSEVVFYVDILRLLSGETTNANSLLTNEERLLKLILDVYPLQTLTPTNVLD